MIHGKKIVVVMPAYNSEKTLHMTWDEFPHEVVDEVVLVDVASSINFSRSVKYGLGVLATSFKFLLHKAGVVRSAIFVKVAAVDRN